MSMLGRIILVFRGKGMTDTEIVEELCSSDNSAYDADITRAVTVLRDGWMSDSQITSLILYACSGDEQYIPQRN